MRPSEKSLAIPWLFFSSQRAYLRSVYELAVINASPARTHTRVTKVVKFRAYNVENLLLCQVSFSKINGHSYGFFLQAYSSGNEVFELPGQI